MVLTYLGTQSLPYVWILSVVVLSAAVFFFRKIPLATHPVRFMRVQGVIWIGVLILFLPFLEVPAPFVVVAFYVATDVLSLLLIEQCWNGVNVALKHKRISAKEYGYFACGPIVGSMIGAASAFLLVSYELIDSHQLIWGALVCLVLFVLSLERERVLERERTRFPSSEDEDALPLFKKSQSERNDRWLFWTVLLSVFAAQLLHPCIDYLFLREIELQLPGLDTRTEFLALFFVLSSGAAMLFNLALWRYLSPKGAVKSFMLQPFTVVAGSIGFLFLSPLWAAGILKLFDRAISYSFTRASKEILYAGFQVKNFAREKAKIDIVGYRLGRFAGSLLVFFLVGHLSGEALGRWLIGLAVFFALCWLGTVMLYRMRSLR